MGRDLENADGPKEEGRERGRGEGRREGRGDDTKMESNCGDRGITATAAALVRLRPSVRPPVPPSELRNRSVNRYIGLQLQRKREGEGGKKENTPHYRKYGAEKRFFLSVTCLSAVWILWRKKEGGRGDPTLCSL